MTTNNELEEACKLHDEAKILDSDYLRLCSAEQFYNIGERQLKREYSQLRFTAKMIQRYYLQEGNSEVVKIMKKAGAHNGKKIILLEEQRKGLFEVIEQLKEKLEIK